MASLLDLPVDVLGDIGIFLKSADRRSLARVSSGLRRTAISLWPDDVAARLKRYVVRGMAVDVSFCALVRNTLLDGPLEPLPITVTVEYCCVAQNKEETVGTAADGFCTVTECSICGARDHFPHPPAAYELSYTSGFHRVDVMGAKALQSVAQLVCVNTLVLVECAVSDIACLAESKTLRKLALSRCDAVTALPHIPSLQRAEIRCCRALTSVDALAHARAVVLEGCEGVCDVSSLAGVHEVTLECRLGLTDVSALFLGRVHSLVLDHVAILPLPEGARIHSLTLSAVLVGVPHAAEGTFRRHRVAVSRGHLTPSVRDDFGFWRSSEKGVDVSGLSVKSLSLCIHPLEPYDDNDKEHEYTRMRSATHPTPLKSPHILASSLTSVRLLAYTDDLHSLSWVRHVSKVVVELWYGHGERIPDLLAPLARVPCLTVGGFKDKSVFGLLSAVAEVMRESPTDVNVQRHGCGALAGRRWSIGLKRDRFRDERFSNAVLAAISTFPGDYAVVCDGFRSLARMIPPTVKDVPRDKEAPCMLAWVGSARACLARDGVLPSCAGAALSLLRGVLPSGYLAVSDIEGLKLRDALPLDDVAHEAIRVAQAFAEDVVVLEPAVEIVYFCALMPLVASSRRMPNGFTDEGGRLYPNDFANIRLLHRQWVPSAIGMVLSLARRCPLRGRDAHTAMRLLANIADMDRSCALAILEAGALDMLLERGAACLALPFNEHVDDTWIIPLGRLAQYTHNADPGCPPLLSADLMFDVARRVSRWAIDAGRVHGGLVELLLAGESRFPPPSDPGLAYVDAELGVARDLFLSRAVRRHRRDPDLAVAAALAFDSNRFQDGGVPADSAVLEALAAFVAPSPRVQAPIALNVLSAYGGGVAVGRAGDGFVFLSAVIKAALLRTRDDVDDIVFERVRRLAGSLYDLVAANEDCGCADAVDAALDNCLACLEQKRLWSVRYRPCLQDLARSTALLLLAKNRAEGRHERGPVAPATVCTVAVTALLGSREVIASTNVAQTPKGLRGPSTRRPQTDAFDDVAVPAIRAAVEAIGGLGTVGALGTSAQMLLSAARSFVCRWELFEAVNSRATIAVDGNVVQEARIARSVLAAVAGGGLCVAKAAQLQPRVGISYDAVVGVAALFAVCAMNGPRQLASLVEDVPHTMRLLRRLPVDLNLAPGVRATALAALDDLLNEFV